MRRVARECNRLHQNRTLARSTLHSLASNYYEGYKADLINHAGQVSNAIDRAARKRMLGLMVQRKAAQHKRQVMGVRRVA